MPASIARFMISGVSVISVARRRCRAEARMRVADRPDALEIRLLVENHAAAAIGLEIDETGGKEAPAQTDRFEIGGDVIIAIRRSKTMSPDTSTAAFVVTQMAVKNLRAGQGDLPRHMRFRHFSQIGRLVGIEAQAPGEAFDESIEGHDEQQRIGERVTAPGEAADCALRISPPEVTNTSTPRRAK